MSGNISEKAAIISDAKISLTASASRISSSCIWETRVSFDLNVNVKRRRRFECIKAVCNLINGEK